MTTRAIRDRKSNPFLLSEQVKTILHKEGFSKVFNYQDYDFFKQKAKTAFNKAQAIAQMFLSENTTSTSDFNEYIF
jgi:hypothetical protein